MFMQCIAAICTLAVIVVAILIMTQAISLGDVLKAVGKALLAVLVLYAAVCLLAPPLLAGLAAIAGFLKLIARWLAVAISIVLLAMLVVRLRRRRDLRRSNAKNRRGAL